MPVLPNLLETMTLAACLKWYKMQYADTVACLSLSESSQTEYLNRIISGDCLTALATVPDNSVDLIVTSPPYADARKGTYGGIHPDKYVEWFMPRAEQFQRVLKPDGTFILNTKEKVMDGQSHTYVLELIYRTKAAGMALDGRVHVAQEELLSRQVA